MSLRPYLLSPKAEGLPPRIVQASTRAQALAIASATTWDASPLDAPTVRACGYLNVHVEPVERVPDLLDETTHEMRESE